MLDYNRVFLSAVTSGDAEALELAIAGKVDIHAPVERNQFDSRPPFALGVEALYLAISATRDRQLRSGHLQVIRRLVEIGVDVNFKYLLDVSSYPVQKAVHTNHKELFDLLIELGATFWTTGPGGQELIRWAAYYGLDWLVDQFLEQLSHGVPDQEVTHGLELALCGAARRGHVAIVRNLLDFGVEADVRESHDTALMGAAASGHRDVAELLIERGADIHTQGDRGRTVLIAAAQGGLTELGLRLLNEGADVHATDFYGRTPLHGAASSGDERLARELIGRGANLKARDDGSNSVLDNAAYGGNRWIIEACLNAGEDVNTQDDWGYIPIMNAAKVGCIEAMEVLVERGANIRHVAHYQGETALYYSIIGEQIEAARWLLERGADPNALVAEPDERTSLLGVAASKNHVELARLLVSFGARPVLDEDDSSTNTPPIHCAAWSNALEMIAFLLSLGVPVDSRDEENNTPLYCVPSPEAARLLLQAGANPNERGMSSGLTKFWLAANYGLDDLGKVLLEYGADPTIPDTQSNRTPYEVALQEGNISFVQMLDAHFKQNDSRV